MDWVAARERLGAELVGARDSIARAWRQSLTAQGAVPTALEPLAAELILQAGAALADGMQPETPWTRCGGILRVDAGAGDRGLAHELAALYAALTRAAERLCFSEHEERAVRDVLGRQLEACLRGAAAEAHALQGGQPLEDPALRFGGVKLLCWGNAHARPATRAA